MNKYNCYYKNKLYTVDANTSYQAQQVCSMTYGIKKSYDITVVLTSELPFYIKTL